MDPPQIAENIMKLKQTSSRALHFQWILLTLLFVLQVLELLGLRKETKITDEGIYNEENKIFMIFLQ